MRICVEGEKEKDVFQKIYVRMKKCQQLHIISKLLDVVFARRRPRPFDVGNPKLRVGLNLFGVPHQFTGLTEHQSQPRGIVVSACQVIEERLS